MLCRYMPLLLAGCLSLFSVLSHATSFPEQLDSLTEKWLRIEKQITALDSEWRQSEPALLQRIELLKAERSQLKSLLSQNEEQSSDVEAKREALLAQQNILEAQQQSVEQSLMPLNGILDTIYPLLPEVLKQRWDEERSQLIEGAGSSLQLQVILAQLSSLNKFNSSITVHESVMNTPDNKAVMIKQLYLGSSYAWFTNSDGQYQGIGNSLSGRWEWFFDTPSDVIDEDSLDNIRKAIAIYEKQRQPEYVLLPLDLRMEVGK